MAARFENFSLQDMVAKGEDAFRLYSLAVTAGQHVRSYRGEYFRLGLGDASVVVRMMSNGEDGEDQLLGMDTHAVSKCVWDCKIIKDITPPDADPLSRRLVVGVDGTEHIATVDVLCAQVLPSCNEGERIRLNMAAFPLRVAYSEEGGENLVDAQDNSVILQGVVKDVRVGETYMGLELLTKFVTATVTTSMGDVEMCHSFDAVSEEQKDLVKVGSVVSAYCVLSGDAAVGEYAGGLVYGEEQDLRLLEDIFTNGEAERISSILHSDCSLTFLQNHQNGAELVYGLLSVVAEDLSEAGLNHVVQGRIVGVEQTGKNPPLYIPGKRCLLLGDDKGGFAFLCYVETDSLGRLKNITITNDARYDVEVLEK